MGAKFEAFAVFKKNFNLKGKMSKHEQKKL